MKTFLLLLGAAGMTGGEAVRTADTCPVPATAGADSASRFDPLVINLKGDKLENTASTACPAGSAEAAKEIKLITTKAPHKTSATQNGQVLRTSPGQAPAAEPPAADAHAINTKGTGATGRAAADHAINTKGTGMAGRAAADHAINTKGTGMAGRAAADHAINTKGTGMAGRASDPNAGCGDSVAGGAEQVAIDCRGAGTK
jgi:hypothetical protein